MSKAERRDRSPFVRSDKEAICGLDGRTGNDRTTEAEAVSQRIRLPVYPAVHGPHIVQIYTVGVYTNLM